MAERSINRPLPLVCDRLFLQRLPRLPLVHLLRKLQLVSCLAVSFTHVRSACLNNKLFGLALSNTCLKRININNLHAQVASLLSYRLDSIQALLCERFGCCAVRRCWRKLRQDLQCLFVQTGQHLRVKKFVCQITSWGFATCSRPTIPVVCIHENPFEIANLSQSMSDQTSHFQNLFDLINKR